MRLGLGDPALTLDCLDLERMKLVTAAQMQELDRRTIQELGVPSLVLMENAGRATFEILRREFPSPAGPVTVVAGRGNNGGDGFVVARYLANAGCPVAVFLLGQKDRVSGDARVNLELASRLNLKIVEVLTDDDLNPLVHHLARSGLIVDALLGTGLNAEVRGLMRTLVEKINGLRVPTLAVDMPSGLSADNGRPLGVAVQAEVTVTFGSPKLGQILAPGRDYVGRLWLVDIGIPPAFSQELPVELAGAGDLRQCLPARPFASHKGTFGHLLLLAASEGKTGAATLAAEGALRTGVGLVTAGVAASLNDILEAKITEAMTLPLPEAEGARALGRSALQPVLKFLENKITALALGPGLGTAPETQDLVRSLVLQVPLPMVIDADGVNALAGQLDCLKGSPGPRLLTPHPGEMAHLLGVTVPEVQADRLGIAAKVAQDLDVWVVLKGAQTLVAAPDGRVSLNASGNPFLASGGTGDVLTGLIGGFLAQRRSPWDAARLGVYLHGLAADYLAQEQGRYGLIAGDLLTVTPEVLGRFAQGRFPLAEEGTCLQRVIL